jgi:hypothetical protein
MSDSENKDAKPVLPATWTAISMLAMSSFTLAVIRMAMSRRTDSLLEPL